MTFFIRGAVSVGREDDYSSSIETKVEILFSNPYRFYISPFVWIMRGSSRIDELKVLYNEAYKQKKFKLCLKIEEVIEYLNIIYGIEPVRVNMKKIRFEYRIMYKLEKFFTFT